MGVIGGVVLLVGAGVIGALAVGGNDSSTAPTTPPASAPPASAEPALSEPIESTTPALTEPPTLAFGDAITYEDDAAVRLVSVKTGTISEVAAGGSRARDVLVKVTVKITAGNTPIDLSPDVKLQWGADGQTAETVFDEGIDAMQDAPSVLRSHKSVTGVFGFAVPKGKTGKLTVTVTPGFDYQEATFEGHA